MKKYKLHITLTEPEYKELNEMKTYFCSMESRIAKDFGKTIPISYSWLIGSAIRECYKKYFQQND